ncbi:MAG: tripartite tricarboxylate transporter TctB family protein [Lachnospiraceae bacterium]|nr:tripartite tricarboxylate transporter TctB family protein [Lachnospiraceae bacterium]
MKKSFADMIIGIVLLAFLTSLAVQVPAIPEVSRGYPLVLLIISYVMTIWLLVTSVLKQKKEEKQETQVVEQVKIIVPYCLMITVYLVMMSKIGYIASTVLFMIASLIYLKLKNKVVLAVLSVLLTIILYFVFTNFLTVILPRGSWFNIAF